MDVAGVIGRVRQVAAVRADAVADRAGLEVGLRSVAVVRAWLTAAEADLASRLAGCASFPEQAIADAGRESQVQASRVLERAATLGAAPALADALDDGAVTAGHIDAVTKIAQGLQGGQRARLIDRADRLVAIARHGTVSEFRRRLEHEARMLQTDDGTARFERQQAAARLRHWTDSDGMWCLAGRFDPLTGIRIHARLTAELEASFAEPVPAACPSDPHAKNEFLAAAAMVRIIDGVVTAATGPGRPEFVVVIDAGDSSGDGGGSGGGSPRVEWAIPVEVPWTVLADLAGDADIHPVVIRNGVVLHAPGVLDLGRSTRLANRAQRRALRALYDTCAIPGCDTRYERCKIHHLTWWRHGGRTDLANLLPLCTRHHSNIHDNGRHITLDPHRQLTLTLPDGTIHNTGPPRRRAA